MTGAAGTLKNIYTLLHRVPRRWLLLQIKLLVEGRVLKGGRDGGALRVSADQSGHEPAAKQSPDRAAGLACKGANQAKRDRYNALRRASPRE